jgi:hypothetical protein
VQLEPLDRVNTAAEFSYYLLNVGDWWKVLLEVLHGSDYGNEADGDVSLLDVSPCMHLQLTIRFLKGFGLDFTGPC